MDLDEKDLENTITLLGTNKREAVSIALYDVPPITTPICEAGDDDSSSDSMDEECDLMSDEEDADVSDDDFWEEEDELIENKT